MEVTHFIARISREGIHTSSKEPVEVSQAVIFEGLRFLQVSDAEEIVAAAESEQ